MAAGRGGRGRAFTDDRGKVWTPTGVAQTVFSPSRFGGGALDLSATAGDSLLTTSALADFSFPGMFTIDFWLFWTGQAGVIFTAEGLGAYFSGSAENPTIYLDDFRVTNGATRYGQPNYAPPSGQAPNGPTDPFWPNVVSLLRFNN